MNKTENKDDLRFEDWEAGTARYHVGINYSGSSHRIGLGCIARGETITTVAFGIHISS